MDTLIRPARPSDVEDMVRLLGALFSLEADFQPDPERQRRGLALMLSDARSRCVFIAERSGVVIGMATAQLLASTAEGAPSALVEDVVVEVAERRHGIGRRLLAALETWARDRGATRMQLLADRENAPALRFYERTGWRATRLACLRRSLS